MKVGSLFAGIGGFDLGFLRAGFEVAWCVEFDKNAQAVLRARFPNAVIYGDIREVDETKLERVDVICGGFPCQDVSVAGKRAGLAGQRTGLFYDAMRIVRHINPSVLVLENVPGLLSSNHGLDFAAVLREVGEGWDCEEVAWRILDSQYFGVAQRRNRVFIVASSSVGHAEQILALNESVCGDPPTRRAQGQDIAADSQGSPPASRRVYGGSSQFVSDTVTSKWHKGSGGPAGSECGLFVAEIPMYTLTTNDVHAVASSTEGMIVRRLTPVECERLQGFPDGWTDIGTAAKPSSDGNRYKQLGNAVTVNVAEWIARRVHAPITL